jgi:dihydrofolate synthase/folylpolyglutamate synthase
MRFQTLQQWLDWQETLHPREIELGLERVRAVWQRLHPEPFKPRVITVGGTNGKGSCVAFLEAILRAADYRTGCYTSPHLLRYNERIRLDGAEASDQSICSAFERIDQARQETSLTYFEFGTLAALSLFAEAALDVVILEVGLGGRLDAVNIMQPDAALITSIGLEHTDWLGDTREAIAMEKAGILRPGKPAIIGDLDPPLNLRRFAQEVAVPAKFIGEDYGMEQTADGWRWWGRDSRMETLPLPQLTGRHQLQNGASVLALLESVAEQLPVSEEAVRSGLQSARVAGRFQRIEGEFETILDVAHNPDAAATLAQSLRAAPCSGRTLALFSALSDKNIPAVAEQLRDAFHHWHLAPLEGSRAATASALLDGVREGGVAAERLTLHPSIAKAWRALRESAAAADRVVVFGSFQTVAEVLHLLNQTTPVQQ